MTGNGLKNNAILITLLVLCGLFPFSETHAVNWLMLQGTEPSSVTHRPIIFIQPGYTKDLGQDIQLGPNAGKRAIPTLVAPWFEDDEKWHVRRARAGVRGNFTGDLRNPVTEKMNYFLLFEFAPNLLTYSFLGEQERAVALDHVSITANHIPGARLRFGLFKTPGLEETYQGIVTQDYIEFTDFAAREMLERYASGNFRASVSGGVNGAIGTPVTQSQGFNGVRDWGLQVFDSFKQQGWDYSYALMLGRGAGIQERERSQDALEQYYYLSAEQDLPGGSGPRKHGIKYYAWLQQGERVFSSDPLHQVFDRKRYGVGIRAQGRLFGLSDIQRLDIALTYAEGMIFVSPAGAVKGGNLMFAAEDGNRSRALSIDYGYFLTPKLEVMARWDHHELLYRTDGVVWTDGDARDITGKTIGVQYHFSPKLRLTANFIDRNIDAPNENHPVVEDVIGSIGQRYALQLTWVY